MFVSFINFKSAIFVLPLIFTKPSYVLCTWKVFNKHLLPYGHIGKIILDTQEFVYICTLKTIGLYTYSKSIKMNHSTSTI